MKPRVVEMHPKQYEAFTFNTQFGAAVAGVQSGKTFLGSYWAAKKISEYPKEKGLIAAPSFKVLQHSTLNKFFKEFPHFLRYYKEQKGVIDLPGGGGAYIRSADKPLLLEGMTLPWAWLDEAGMMSYLVWVVIRSRVAITKGQVLITTTPYNMGWLYRDFYIPWKEQADKDLSFYTWKSIDNPFFDKEFAEKEKIRLRPEEYKRRYEGQFSRLEGLVWPIPKDQIISLNPQLMAHLQYPDGCFMGIDWGYVNPTGLLVGKLKSNILYIVDEWKESQKTTGQIVEKCGDLINKHGVQILYPDPAEPDRNEELRQKNYIIGQVNKDVAYGLSVVGQLIREKRLFITQNCVNLIDEIESYHYAQPREGINIKETPVKENDHLCDALRYMAVGISSHRFINRPQEEVYIQHIRSNKAKYG